MKKIYAKWLSDYRKVNKQKQKHAKVLNWKKKI
jgi:hypothetical protein